MDLKEAEVAPAAYPPPSFTIQLNDVECSEGERSHFQCTVEPASDPNLKVIHRSSILDLWDAHASRWNGS